MLVIRFTNTIDGGVTSFIAEQYGDDGFTHVISAISNIVGEFGELTDEQKLLIKIGDIENNFPIQVSYYDDGNWDDYDEYQPETVSCITKEIANNIIERGNECNPTDVWLLWNRLQLEDWGNGEVACLESYWEDYPDVDPLTLFRFTRDCTYEYMYADTYEEFGKAFLFDICGECVPDGVESYIDFETYGEDILDGNEDFIDLIGDYSIVITNVCAWPTSTTSNYTRFNTYRSEGLITRDEYNELTSDNYHEAFNNVWNPLSRAISLNDSAESAISTFLNCEEGSFLWKY